MEEANAFVGLFEKLNFFLSSGNFRLITLLIFLYAAMLWLAIIVWVTRDAIHRTSSVFFQICAVLINIFLPIFGLMVYLIVRPEKTLLEKYHEELEYRLLEGGDDVCSSCGTVVKENFAFCPRCGEGIYKTCGSCQKQFARRWPICPHCGTPEEKPHSKRMKKKKPTEEIQN